MPLLLSGAEAGTGIAVSFALGLFSTWKMIYGAETDRTGFCRKHTKMMYDYGNYLGKCLDFKNQDEVFTGTF